MNADTGEVDPNLPGLKLAVAPSEMEPPWQPSVGVSRHVPRGRDRHVWGPKARFQGTIDVSWVLSRFCVDIAFSITVHIACYSLQSYKARIAGGVVL